MGLACYKIISTVSTLLIGGKQHEDKSEDLNMCNNYCGMPFAMSMLFVACSEDKDERIAELEAENQTLENDISELRQQYAADIAEYGLYTYEEFSEIFPVSEEVFEAFNGKYLKAAMGKGLITESRIGELIERYSEFF